MERYTIEQLKNRGNAVVHVDNCEQVKHIDKVFDKNHDYLYKSLEYKKGNQCIEIKNSQHSSLEYFTEAGYLIVKYDQIDFEENLLNNIQIW